MSRTKVPPKRSIAARSSATEGGIGCFVLSWWVGRDSKAKERREGGRSILVGKQATNECSASVQPLSLFFADFSEMVLAPYIL